MRRTEERSNIVCGDGRNTAVRRTAYAAFGGDIPKRYIMSAQKLLLLLDRLRQRCVEHGGEHAPKAVLRMPVIKAAFAGFDRGETAEYEYSALTLKKRLKRMYHCYRSFAMIIHRLSFFRNTHFRFSFFGRRIFLVFY